MQQEIKILPISAELYPAYYNMVQQTTWGNPMLPTAYNNKLWGDVLLLENQMIGGWVGTIRGDIPVARFITKSVYFDSYPIFANVSDEQKYIDDLIFAIKQHAKKERVVMLNLTHWVREGKLSLDAEHLGASFISQLHTTEECLWGQVESKQRNCIRKGQKSGVEVFAYQAEEALKYLDDFQILRQRTQQHAIRNHAQASMLLKSNRYFHELFLNPNATLFIAVVESKVAAVALMLQSGSTVYYYSGGSDYELNKKYSCSALLIWKAMLYYNEHGLSIFDMGGVPVSPTKEHPAYGVYAFKRSFGGEYREFDGGQIIIAPRKYKLLQFFLSQRKLLRLLSKKL